MITFVKLKNWKSHRETELVFGDGTNVLVGIMGSGKSSVMEGITYALFGTLPAVQSRRIKLEDLITSRPKPLDRAEVEVHFLSPEGEEYSVRRVVERGSGTTLAELRKVSGELIEGPNSSRVTEAIGSILDLDYDLFERAIYSEQNRLDYFLTLPRGKRMESIDELLGINKLEKARKSLGSMITRITERAEEREIAARNLGQDPAIPALPVYLQEIAQLESSRQEIQVQLGQLRTELESIRAQDQRFRALEQQLRSLEQSKRALESAAEMLGRSIDELRQRLGAHASLPVERIKAESDEVESSLAAKTSRLNSLLSSLTEVSSQLQGLEARKAMTRDAAEKLRIEIEHKRAARAKLEALKPLQAANPVDKIQEELRRADDALAGYRARIKDLVTALDELEEAEAICPVCETPLTKMRKEELLEQRRRELRELEGKSREAESLSSELKEKLRRARELQQSILLLEKEVEPLPSLEREHSETLRRLSELEAAAPELLKKREALVEEVERTRNEVDELNKKLSTLRQVLQNRADLDSRVREHQFRLVEISQVEKKLEQLRMVYDEAKAESVRRQAEQLVGSLERLRAELQGKEQLMAEKRRLVETVKEKLRLVKWYEAEARRLREAAMAMSTIQTALARTQTTMRKMFIEGVNMVMNDLWESIYPYGDFVGIRLGVENGDRGDYVLQLRDRSGNWIPVDGIASGGERTDAALALRISFSMVLAPKLNWIVFDEPTHNLDAEGIQELAKVLRDRLPDFVRQILLITHEERLENAVSGYLYRFTRDKREDEPTRVEQVTAPELYD
ncbi:MAG: SMC family ATPase [Candidatus Hadarchaeum sp.]|uniref:SMC family ATPase n=1 Tax=Candidatus Hadarchaeum sp. TaxID=2883567 RepID=UPI00317180C1